MQLNQAQNPTEHGEMIKLIDHQDEAAFKKLACAGFATVSKHYPVPWPLLKIKSDNCDFADILSLIYCWDHAGEVLGE